MNGTGRYEPLDRASFEALAISGWTWHAGAIHVEFNCGSFAQAGELAAAIAAEADRVDHHPDMGLRYPGVVRVEITTHAIGATSIADADLARSIDTIATRMGAEAVRD